MKHRPFVSAAILACLAMAPAQAQLFGPSDEDVARAKAHEDSQDSHIQQNAQDLQQLGNQMRQIQEQGQSQIRDLNDRVRSLTDSLARATGANDDLSHQISLLNCRIDPQQKDFNYRLCTLSAQNLGADAGALNCAATGAGNPSRPAAPAQLSPGAALPPLEDNSNRGRPPGVLGQLPAGPSPRQAATDNGGSQFDSAMNLLARAQYPEAAAAFRGYADSHPDDDNSSSQALYWVGYIAYMQQDFPAASRTFAEAVKKYPKASRTPESLLKLGQSLVAQNQASNGCTVFRGITPKQYPNASPSTLAAVATARKTANCK